MTKPKMLQWGDRSGLDVQYTKARRELRLSGWYDSCVGIEPVTLSLGEFLSGLGIDAADCMRALTAEHTKPLRKS